MVGGERGPDDLSTTTMCTQSHSALQRPARLVAVLKDPCGGAMKSPTRMAPASYQAVGRDSISAWPARNCGSITSPGVDQASQPRAVARAGGKNTRRILAFTRQARKKSGQLAVGIR